MAPTWRGQLAAASSEPELPGGCRQVRQDRPAASLFHSQGSVAGSLLHVADLGTVASGQARQERQAEIAVTAWKKNCRARCP
jgi:hypothetical protein